MLTIESQITKLKEQKHNNSSPYDLCSIFQVFWSHTITLWEKKTKCTITLLNFSLLKTEQEANIGLL